MITENLEEFYIEAPSGSIMCIDYGTKRSGIAFSDANRLLSLPFTTIKTKTLKECLLQITKIVKTKNPKSIVIGLPLHLNGISSNQTEITRKFAILLNQDLKLPIFMQDERFSSKGAHSYLKDLQFNRKEREEMCDMTSASLILEIVLQRIQYSCIKQ
jgi:putative Holliday junction resolvase